MLTIDLLLNSKLQKGTLSMELVALNNGSMCNVVEIVVNAQAN